MMVKRKINVFMIAVFLFSLITGGFQTPVFAAEGENTVSVTVVGDEKTGTLLEKTEVTFDENATALDVLFAAVGEDGVVLDEDNMITAIKGLEDNDTYYWMYYVNGISAPVGADSYNVQAGEELTFHFEKWEKANAVTIKVVGKDGKVINESPWPNSIYGQPTAFQLLQSLVGPENVGYEVDPKYGVMINSISGLAAEGYSYWSFLVNGEWASVGADSYVLQYGDQITFQYETYVPPVETPGEGSGEPTGGSVEETPTEIKPIDSAVLQTTIDSAIAQIPVDQVGDWEAVALSQAGKKIPADYLENVTKTILEANGTFRKITDYERYTLGIVAAGGDPTNVGGFNLVSSIYNGDVTKQGLNGVAYALIALDSANFKIPETAKWTREKLVQHLVEYQQADGRWTGLGSDIDLTAMVLTALAPYKAQANVSETVNKAVDYLSAQYLAGKIDNTQAVAQVIIALSALKIDLNGAKFTQDGSSIISYLLSFKNADNGFAWKKGGESEIGATTQAVHGLVAYQFYVNGKGSLFDFTLITKNPVEINPVAAQTKTVDSPTVESTSSQEGKLLPNTASNTFNLFAMGLLIIMIGIAAFVIDKRKQA